MLTIRSHLVPRLYQRIYTQSPTKFLRGLDRDNYTARGLSLNLRSDRLATNHLLLLLSFFVFVVVDVVLLLLLNNNGVRG
jgi:hypothetical protein